MNFADRARIQYHNAQIADRSAAARAEALFQDKKAEYIREGHPSDRPFIPKESLIPPQEEADAAMGRRKYNDLDPHINVNDEALDKNLRYTGFVDQLDNITDLKSRFVRKKPGPKPEYRTYGRFLVQKKKFDDGMLSVRFNDSSNKPYDFRGVHYMGPELKRVMKQLVEGEGMVDISRLPLKDQTYVKHFQKRSGLPMDRIVGDGMHSELSAASKRLEKVIGSITAGNDSKKLRNELNSLLNKLKRGGLISGAQMARISEAFLE